MPHPTPTAELEFANPLGMGESSEPLSHTPAPPYVGAMAVSAHTIAAAIRERQPAAGMEELHALLYYAQGHHLETFGRPLFTERIRAIDAGPAIDDLDDAAPVSAVELAALGEAELNTVGYTVSRYGDLSAPQLRERVRSEEPWQLATQRGRVGVIEPEWMREFFTRRADEESPIPLDHPQLRAMLDRAKDSRNTPARTDSPNIRAWLDSSD